MKTLEINLAGGGDNTIDPRVAPSGTIARAVNLRLDRQGRLVPRSGYTSLGVTVAGAGTGLVPFDLYAMDGDLICAGNNAPAQTGIRDYYRLVNDPQGVWRAEKHGTAVSGPVAASDNSDGLLHVPAADGTRIVATELDGADGDTLTADCAVTANGAFAMLVVTDTTAVSFTRRTRVVQFETATGKVVGSTLLQQTERAKVLAIGQVFLLVYQDTTGSTMRCLTVDTAVTHDVGAATTILAGVTVLGGWDIAAFKGSTDWLVAMPTAAGYTWRRYNLALAQQTTTNVASTADQQVSICGSSTAGNVVVVNAKGAAGGYDLRTFTSSTGVLLVGPTTLFAGFTMTWLGIDYHPTGTSFFVSSVRVITSTPNLEHALRLSTNHGLISAPAAHVYCEPATKLMWGPLASTPLVIWETIGTLASQAPYALISMPLQNTTTYDPNMSAVVFDGSAKRSYSTNTRQFSSGISFAGTVAYAALVTQDTRDKSYRANLVSVDLLSGQRRSAVAIAGKLYSAGGISTVYDRRLTTEIGFDSVPQIVSLTGAIGSGSLTALGLYTYFAVNRSVSANGDVAQSTPSSPATITLGAGVNQVSVVINAPYSWRRSFLAEGMGTTIFVDLYRTEAGGSIPRLVKSVPVYSFGVFGGLFASFTDGIADTVQQLGGFIYTQGADGAVSGRLPLALASGAKYVAEVRGKLLLAGLPKDTELQISVEPRPGEEMGFVNDDIFFISNPERVTGIATARDGRVYIFSASSTRELIGDGPNAAGTDATLQEPTIVDPHVGCADWRSIAVTEFGVVFQGSRGPDPKLYVIPDGGSAAVLISEGIRDTLRAYPVVSSVTRHEAEQLLTFTLQNTAGTDGRLIHLDLQTSGLTQRGWVGHWFVDRIPQLEGVADIEIVEERYHTFANQAANVQSTIPLPAAKRIGDRILIFTHCVAAAAVSTGSMSGFTLRDSITSGTTVQSLLWEQILTASSQQTVASVDYCPSTANAYSLIVRTVLVRGAHPSQIAETATGGTSGGSAQTCNLSTLTPSWGSAKNLWITGVMNNSADIAAPFTNTWTGPPSGFERIAETSINTDLRLQTVSNGSRILEAASLPGVSWASAPFTTNCAIMAAVRPLATPGTPARSSVQFGGRLVVCNNTDVLKSDSAAVADIGAAFIASELELADLYPMGPGGDGRHLSLVFVGELLGFCQLNCALSYDSGRNWTALQSYLLSTLNGFSVGQTLRLLWVPKRRKITGVRARFSVSENTVDAPLAGDTPGVAMQRAFFQFDELLGPSRMQPSQRK